MASYGPISRKRASIATHCPIFESHYSSFGISLASKMGNVRLPEVNIRVGVHLHIRHPMYSAWLA